MKIRREKKPQPTTRRARVHHNQSGYMHRASLPWQLIYKYISKRSVLATIERDRKRARNRRGAMDGDLGRDELNAPLNQFSIPFTVSHCLVYVSQ